MLFPTNQKARTSLHEKTGNWVSVPTYEDLKGNWNSWETESHWNISTRREKTFQFCIEFQNIVCVSVDNSFYFRTVHSNSPLWYHLDSRIFHTNCLKNNIKLSIASIQQFSPVKFNVLSPQLHSVVFYLRG